MTTKQILIARAPVLLWQHEIRPGDTFTTDEGTTAQLIEQRAAEIYADQKKPGVPHYSGEGRWNARSREDRGIAVREVLQ